MPDIEEQEQILWIKELDDYVRHIHFIFDGLYVLAVTSGGSAYAFSKSGAGRLFCRQLHNGAIICSAVSPQHSLLATGGEDGRFFISNLQSGEIIYQYSEPGKWIEHALFSPDGNYVAFTCGKKVFIITANGELYDTITSTKSIISAIAWSLDGALLAVGSFGGVDLCHVETKELYQHLPWKNAVVSLTISTDKRFVCSGTQDCQVHIWPLPYSAESDMAITGFQNKVKHLHWHFEGDALATNSGRNIVVWDFGGNGPANKEPKILRGHFLNVTALAYQHNNDILVSADEGGLMMFFCPKLSNRSNYIVNVNERITTLSWSPDDKMVAVGTANGGLYMIVCPIEND
jgi:WD40 repeat protein